MVGLVSPQMLRADIGSVETQPPVGRERELNTTVQAMGRYEQEAIALLYMRNPVCIGKGEEIDVILIRYSLSGYSWRTSARGTMFAGVKVPHLACAGRPRRLVEKNSSKIFSTFSGGMSHPSSLT